jgi:hypothetical protein
LRCAVVFYARNVCGCKRSVIAADRNAAAIACGLSGAGVRGDTPAKTVSNVQARNIIFAITACQHCSRAGRWASCAVWNRRPDTHKRQAVAEVGADFKRCRDKRARARRFALFLALAGGAGKTSVRRTAVCCARAACIVRLRRRAACTAVNIGVARAKRNRSSNITVGPASRFVYGSNAKSVRFTDI